jgi:hypothetical protein
VSKKDIPIDQTETRHLKVYYGSHSGKNYSRHPIIRIAGKYLRDFGFKIGDNIEVKLSQGRIEISKVINEKDLQ